MDYQLSKFQKTFVWVFILFFIDGFLIEHLYAKPIQPTVMPTSTSTANSTNTANTANSANTANNDPLDAIALDETPIPRAITTVTNTTTPILLKQNNVVQPRSNTSPSISPDAKLTFYFKEINVRTLLEIISKKSGYNFVISDKVQGNMTLNLKDVTWKQALNTVLDAKGLTTKRSGNILYITTLDEKMVDESKEFQSLETINNLLPLQQSIITLKHADADSMSDLIRGKEGGGLLSARGKVISDPRTNTLILLDRPKNITDIIRAVNELDIPARQVVIEARIVSVSTTSQENIGARFGITSVSRGISGTLNAANQIIGGTTPSAVTPTYESRLNFDNPAAALTNGSAVSSIGLALAKLGPIFLDLELSALESEGKINIISRPRVVAANQQKAIIQSGQEIPYQESTSSGATSTSFKKAVLSLEILPSITKNNKIMLKLKANQDSQGPQLLVSPGTQTSQMTATTTVVPASYGPPTINTQSVESSILLNDNETFVVGGIFQINKNKQVSKIPFLGSLPYIGFLFRNTSETDQKQELLIFVTPKIIEAKSATPSKDEEV